MDPSKRLNMSLDDIARETKTDAKPASKKRPRSDISAPTPDLEQRLNMPLDRQAGAKGQNNKPAAVQPKAEVNGFPGRRHRHRHFAGDDQQEDGAPGRQRPRHADKGSAKHHPHKQYRGQQQERSPDHAQDPPMSRRERARAAAAEQLKEDQPHEQLSQVPMHIVGPPGFHPGLSGQPTFIRGPNGVLIPMLPNMLPRFPFVGRYLQPPHGQLGHMQPGFDGSSMNGLYGMHPEQQMAGGRDFVDMQEEDVGEDAGDDQCTDDEEEGSQEEEHEEARHSGRVQQRAPADNGSRQLSGRHSRLQVSAGTVVQQHRDSRRGAADQDRDMGRSRRGAADPDSRGRQGRPDERSTMAIARAVQPARGDSSIDGFDGMRLEQQAAGYSDIMNLLEEDANEEGGDDQLIEDAGQGPQDDEEELEEEHERVRSKAAGNGRVQGAAPAGNRSRHVPVTAPEKRQDTSREAQLPMPTEKRGRLQVSADTVVQEHRDSRRGAADRDKDLGRSRRGAADEERDVAKSRSGVAAQDRDAGRSRQERPNDRSTRLDRSKDRSKERTAKERTAIAAATGPRRSRSRSPSRPRRYRSRTRSPSLSRRHGRAPSPDRRRPQRREARSKSRSRSPGRRIQRDREDGARTRDLRGMHDSARPMRGTARPSSPARHRQQQQQQARQRSRSRSPVRGTARLSSPARHRQQQQQARQQARSRSPVRGTALPSSPARHRQQQQQARQQARSRSPVRQWPSELDQHLYGPVYEDDVSRYEGHQDEDRMASSHLGRQVQRSAYEPREASRDRQQGTAAMSPQAVRRDEQQYAPGQYAAAAYPADPYAAAPAWQPRQPQYRDEYRQYDGIPYAPQEEYQARQVANVVPAQPVRDVGQPVYDVVRTNWRQRQAPLQQVQLAAPADPQPMYAPPAAAMEQRRQQGNAGRPTVYLNQNLMLDLRQRGVISPEDYNSLVTNTCSDELAARLIPYTLAPAAPAPVEAVPVQAAAGPQEQLLPPAQLQPQPQYWQQPQQGMQLNAAQYVANLQAGQQLLAGRW